MSTTIKEYLSRKYSLETIVNIVKHGCKNMMLPGLCEYKDTNNFFYEHLEEIKNEFLEEQHTLFDKIPDDSSEISIDLSIAIQEIVYDIIYTRAMVLALA